MKIGQSTPWGPAQTVKTIVKGITSVTTAGHGGIHLDEAHADKVPARLTGNTWLSSGRWFEEDLDWCIPFVIFEDEIRANGDEHSKKVIREGWHTEAFKVHHNPSVTEEA